MCSGACHGRYAWRGERVSKTIVSCAAPCLFGQAQFVVHGRWTCSAYRPVRTETHLAPGSFTSRKSTNRIQISRVTLASSFCSWSKWDSSNSETARSLSDGLTCSQAATPSLPHLIRLPSASIQPLLTAFLAALLIWFTSFKSELSFPCFAAAAAAAARFGWWRWMVMVSMNEEWVVMRVGTSRVYRSLPHHHRLPWL